MKTSIGKYLTFFILILFFLSCTKEKPDVQLVLKGIIAESKDCTCQPYINQYLWKDKIVFVRAFSGSACDTRPSYYDKDGVEFEMEQGYTIDQFLRESSLTKKMWTCQA
ncbi:MAG: hypothetical protein ACOH2A_00770 [Sphingobacteriaceae bacterium]